jgi:hypothetical protein
MYCSNLTKQRSLQYIRDGNSLKETGTFFFAIHGIALPLAKRIYKISCGLMFGKVKGSD